MDVRASHSMSSGKIYNYPVFFLQSAVGVCDVLKDKFFIFFFFLGVVIKNIKFYYFLPDAT